MRRFEFRKKRRFSFKIGKKLKTPRGNGRLPKVGVRKYASGAVAPVQIPSKGEKTGAGAVLKMHPVLTKEKNKKVPTAPGSTNRLLNGKMTR